MAITTHPVYVYSNGMVTSVSNAAKSRQRHKSTRCGDVPRSSARVTQTPDFAHIASGKHLYRRDSRGGASRFIMIPIGPIRRDDPARNGSARRFPQIYRAGAEGEKAHGEEDLVLIVR